MKNRFSRLMVLFLVGIATTAMGQLQSPAHWTYSSKELNSQEVELQLKLTLDEGWHIYSQHSDPNGPIPMEITFTTNDNYRRIGKVTEPKPHEEIDDVFHCIVRSFSGTVVFKQKVKRLTDKAFTIDGVMYYQLCNDGSCVAPDDIPFSISIPQATMVAEEKTEEDTIDTVMMANAEEDSIDTVIDTLTNEEVGLIAETEEEESGERQSLWVIFILALLSGIVTMFTPCVFPMIPMTVNFFMHASENKRESRRQAWFFGFSIIFIFTILGALLSIVFGPESLNAIGTNGWVNLCFFIIFLTFALSFFGLFEIRLPSKWINSSDEQANKGGFLAPFFIALTTVLISFSCTGPIIGGALVSFATSTTNRWVGLISMLGFGIGFALPFTLLAFFPQMLKKMKSGSWLHSVKIVFAFLELIFGLKFLSIADQYWSWRLLDRDVYLGIWIALFGLLTLYLMGKIHFKGDSEVKEVGLVRLFFIICSMTITIMLIPGLWGAPLNKISGFLPPMDTQDFNIGRTTATSASCGGATTTLPADRKYADLLHMPDGFEGFYDLDEAKEYARQVGKPIFIDFTGRNCANCREMEQSVWSDPQAKQLMNNNFVLCALYADMNAIKLPETEWIEDDHGRTIKTLGRRNLYYQTKTFNMNAQPYYVIIDSEGNVLTRNNFKYSKEVDKFVAFLEEGYANYTARQ